MELRVGQKVRFKKKPPHLTISRDAELTVTRVGPGGQVCVSLEGGGSTWVKTEDLEPVDNEGEEAEQD